jgi:hypothetical protein
MMAQSTLLTQILIINSVKKHKSSEEIMIFFWVGLGTFCIFGLGLLGISVSQPNPTQILSYLDINFFFFD